jgi:hypothetical protein
LKHHLTLWDGEWSLVRLTRGANLSFRLGLLNIEQPTTHTADVNLEHGAIPIIKLVFFFRRRDGHFGRTEFRRYDWSSRMVRIVHVIAELFLYAAKLNAALLDISVQNVSVSNDIVVQNVQSVAIF